MTQALAINPNSDVIESVITAGDLSKLNPVQRVNYYTAVCQSVGLNPLTKPFEYITLNGKMVLYARKDATDQLRDIRKVSITRLERERIDSVYVVTAYAQTVDGRTDSSMGAVNIEGLKGDALANALMKSETKAKRRVTLSICGLGMLDETELGTIPDARPANVNLETGEIVQPPRTVTIERPAAAPWGLRDDAESAMEAPHLQSPTRPLAPRAPAQPKPSAGPTWTPEPDPNGFDDLPSASAERNGGNGKTTPASAHDPAAPWDDNRKAEAVRWAMRRYPEVYNHIKPWQLSLDHLLEKAASEGMDAAQIAQAWKDKCAGKQDELDAKKLQATLDAQAAGDELPVFESR